MQPLLANLYDRILSNRLLRWMKIHDEQTAFLKRKTTIDQIFIKNNNIANKRKLILYVGFFFTYLLLKQLLKLGIGTLKIDLLCNQCVIKGFGKLSQVFETQSGIKQGAKSSVILFFVFLDEIFDHLKRACLIEPIRNDLRCLLHTDDTLLLTTCREYFVHKRDVFLKSISDKKMKLNYSKSLYIIINVND